LFQGVSE